MRCCSHTQPLHLSGKIKDTTDAVMIDLLAGRVVQRQQIFHSRLSSMVDSRGRGHFSRLLYLQVPRGMIRSVELLMADPRRTVRTPERDTSWYEAADLQIFCVILHLVDMDAIPWAKMGESEIVSVSSSL